ncbi:PorP/SprF family type IX secretion system membrane protein [Brumimicrobium mesophilum]|uniref:PorP/SprF family type IX secretion system membrane protein n=1 Tax=Brumimicrobium mesophilum TaxID=392717 RepID=UPI000D14438A|nr:type IX secretion system membrane protein PorP/SprF [Brumimicrobium mesophilum]
MRKFALLLILILSFTGWSQQTTQYSQWSFNQFAINPALAGVKNCLEVRTAVRAQWAGFDGAPTSGLFTINAPLKKKKKYYYDSFHGLGAKIERDVFGPFNNFALTIAYALHFPLGDHHRISFGLSGGLQQFAFDQTQVTTIDPDPAVAQSSNQMLFPLIGAGVWYNSKNYYIGGAIDQFLGSKWEDIGYASRFRLHTKIQAGTKFTFSNKTSLLPGVLVRFPPAGPVSFDLNLMLDFQDNFMVGIGYRNTDALIGFLKLNIKKFTIGYSFDYITSAIRGGNFHTHEISLQFSGCKKEKRAFNACPLFE